MNAIYTVRMRDDGGSNYTVTIEADGVEAACKLAESACEGWVRDGAWGDDGAVVAVYYTVEDEDGEEVMDGSTTVEIEPDHDALIAAAGGDAECEHDWTSDGEGGCRENPGVWSTGGTAMSFAAHCRLCGLHRVTRTVGTQRNPGEHDTVTYRQGEYR